MKFCLVSSACCSRISSSNSFNFFSLSRDGSRPLCCRCLVFLMRVLPEILALCPSLKSSKLCFVVPLLLFPGVCSFRVLTNSLSPLKIDKLCYVLPLVRVPGVSPSRCPSLLQFSSVAIFRMSQALIRCCFSFCGDNVLSAISVLDSYQASFAVVLQIHRHGLGK